jgi:UDP-GlcNAc:undecaprenyl-phosphate/decaprenyl-phosphate GlcNAc-1-phosphate transferase
LNRVVLAGSAGLIITLAITPLVIMTARRTGIVDRPGSLKPQAVSVPYLGGVAVFAGLVFGLFLGRPSVAIPLGGALAIGVADDRFDLPPLLRLVGQVGVGIGVAITCPVHLAGLVSAPIIVMVTVLLINGVNLLDGLDMLAAGVVAVGAIGFAVLTGTSHRSTAVALTGALIGFLVYNRPPARVYLGDGGSYLLGATLSVLLAGTWAVGLRPSSGVVGLALVAVPVGEVVCALVRRRRGRIPLFAGDRGHPYDRLVTRGWPRPAASASYIAVELIPATAAVIVGTRSSMITALVVDVAVGAVVLSAAAATGSLSPVEETTQ